MKTVKKAFVHIKESLQKSSLNSLTAESDARYIIKKRLNLEWSDIISAADQKLDKSTIKQLKTDLDEHLNGKPLSRIYFEQEFYGLKFEISEETLDPRAETEHIVERALKYAFDNQIRSVIDLGTGSGCILLSILTNLHGHAWGVGVDIAEGAVQTARRNAKKLGLENHALFVNSSWAECINTKKEHRFDMLVSNPPYIAPEIIKNLDETVQNHDPILALDGGKGGLQCYKKIFPTLKNILKPGAHAFFEIGYDQGETAARLAEKSDLTVLHVHRDYNDHPRVIELRCGDK